MVTVYITGDSYNLRILRRPTLQKNDKKEQKISKNVVDPTRVKVIKNYEIQTKNQPTFSEKC